MARFAGWSLLWLVMLLMTVWGGIALFYSDLSPHVRPWAAALFGVGAPLLPLLVRPRSRGILAFFALFALLVAWWLTIPPSNNRDWQPDLKSLPWAEIAGDRVTIHNIRNCDYRSESDFTCHYYDRSFDLRRLKTLDLFMVYWGSPFIAHTMLSFGFEGEGYVCLSIETRKEIGEEYSTIKGFFKQYELTYIVADERDVVRLRTNFRKEDVYLYPLKATPEFIRHVLLDYLKEVNSLHDRPQWYNAFTSNCTTSILGHVIPYTKKNLVDWRIIVNGFLGEMLYEQGSVDQSLPFAELKQRSHVNSKAQAADKDAAFSRRIRDALPGSTPGRPEP